MRIVAVTGLMVALVADGLSRKAIANPTVPYYQEYQTVETTVLPATASVTPTVEAPSSFPSPIAVPISPANPQPIVPSVPAVSSDLGDLAVTAIEVQVNGVDAELQQIVRNAIQTRPGGATSQSQLARDVEAILRTGLFTDARVSTITRPEGVSVGFEVVPVVVRSLQLIGARVLSPTIANQIFQAQLGQPINPNLLRQGAEGIDRWYQENGYRVAQVVAVRPGRDGILTIDVAEGAIRQVNIRFVDERGNPVNEQGEPIQGRTQEAFIRREIQLQPGQVFNENAARDDLQRLFDLGLFESANISLSGDAQAIDVTYDLRERLTRSFNVGGGYNDQSGLFATISYRDVNFGGIGQQLNANVQLGTRDFQFNTSFTSPYRASVPDRLGYSVEAFRRRTLSPALTEDVRLPNGDRIRVGQLGGSASVMRPIGEWDAELGLNYTRYSIRDRDGDLFSEDELGNPLTVSGTGIDDLTTVSFQVTQDQRDRPANPTQGSVLTLSTEQSIPIGLGNIALNRLRANYAQYFPVSILDSGTASDPEVLAFNVQGGTIIGDAPPYYAFALGGTNSVRGYEEGRVGTGRSYVLASAEYRFPIFSPVGGVVFADFASDLGTGSTVLGEPGIARNTPGTGFGYGFGVRVRSPFGLIRADLGFNDDGRSQFHLGIGQRF